MREAYNGTLRDKDFNELMNLVKERRTSLFTEVSHENLIYYISIHFEGIIGRINEETEYFIDIISEDENGNQERLTTFKSHSHLKDYEVVKKLNGFKQYICG